MLSVNRLNKVYGSSRSGLEAIRDVTFDVQAGQFVTIVGPSGSGKTTLLRCVCGLLERSGGEVTLAGRLIDSPPEEMACVFQDYSRSLMPWFSVERNVGLPLKNKCDDADERRRRVDDALREVGLEGFGDSYPWQLSGGMQQRVAIARAIAYQPQILLMDEPFASVDAQTRADLEDLILRIRDDLGVTVLFITHDIDEAVYVGDRVVVMSHRPSTVVETIEVDLPGPRDQLATKSLDRFVELRSKVLRLIRGAGRGGGGPAVAVSTLSDGSVPS